MSKREKIIVGAMLLVVVYGVYTVFFAAPRGRPSFGHKAAGADVPLTAFVSKVAEAVKSGVSSKDAYIIQLAESDWQRDPLVKPDLKAAAEKKKKEPVQEPAAEFKLAYTGYLQMGSKKLAIINGSEYEAGDVLEQGGFIVRKISPSRVVLGFKSGRKNAFVLPLEETY